MSHKNLSNGNGQPSQGTPTRSIRVYVVDDHPAIQKAIRCMFDEVTDMEICGTSTSISEALQEMKRLAPDVVIVDLLLKGGHGLDLVEKVRAECPETKPIVYSMYDENVYAERAIRAGAFGYLMKSEPIEDLAEAIRRAAQGEVYFSRQMTSMILGNYAVGKSSAPHFPIGELTESEKRVFKLLGRGHSVEEIQERLGLTRKTVEAYRRRAKEKLGLETVPDLLQHAVLWAFRQWTRDQTSDCLPDAETTPATSDAQREQELVQR